MTSTLSLQNKTKLIHKIDGEKRSEFHYSDFLNYNNALRADPMLWFVLVASQMSQDPAHCRYVIALRYEILQSIEK